jgi:hypothetical protein
MCSHRRTIKGGRQGVRNLLRKKGQPEYKETRITSPAPFYSSDGKNGFLIDYDHVDSWVAKTVEIIDEPQRFRGNGEAARRRAERYSIDKVAEEFLALAERVISNVRRDRIAGAAERNRSS